MTVNQEGQLAAEMRFEHEFTVAVPLVQVWHALSRPEALAASLPRGEWTTVPGAGHTVQGDNPRGLAEAIERFVRRIRAPA